MYIFFYMMSRSCVKLSDRCSSGSTAGSILLSDNFDSPSLAGRRFSVSSCSASSFKMERGTACLCTMERIVRSYFPRCFFPLAIPSDMRADCMTHTLTGTYACRRTPCVSRSSTQLCHCHRHRVPRLVVCQPGLRHPPECLFVLLWWIGSLCGLPIRAVACLVSDVGVFHN